MNILHPMLGMIALSGLLILVLLASRLAPIIKYWGDLQFAEHSEDLRPQLPRPLRLITENYNHIFEQPTLFFPNLRLHLHGRSDRCASRLVSLGLRWPQSASHDHSSDSEQRNSEGCLLCNVQRVPSRYDSQRGS